ncbi:MAG: hypothetical protein AAFN12_10795 [Cyanobacteria bacterium J06560_2]
MSDISIAARLERYTLKYPQEVLMVHAEIEGELDQVVIFRGFSSSLMRPTAFDLEVPVLSDTAVISSIDRLQGPYRPQSPQYVERDISFQDFLSRLSALNL